MIKMVKVGVLGATGMVGQRFIQLLADHPDFEIAALAASGRSAGKKYEDATTWYMNSEMPESVRDITVIETDPAQMDKDVEIVFSSLPADFAAKVEPLILLQKSSQNLQRILLWHQMLVR